MIFTTKRKNLSTLLLLLLAGFVNRSNGQEAPSQLRFHAGGVLGLIASQVDGDDFAGFNKLGVTGGFIAELPLSKYFFISTEILYSQKGSKSHTYPNIPLEYRLKLNYAEVPVLINFQNKPSFNFGAGFSYNRLIKVREFVYGLEQIPNSFDVSTSDFNQLKKNDFNLVVGGSYLFTKNFMVNVRYQYSITAMGRVALSNFNNRGMYNNLLAFRFMYVF